MLGNMMQDQLVISGVLEHAIKTHPQTEIVSHTIEGEIYKYTIEDSAKRAKKLANALKKLEVKEGDILGTIALNGYRHYELYFGISGNFKKTRFSKSCSGLPNALFFSSSDINLYIPRYLRVSWWTTRPSKSKRIVKEISKFKFSVPR